MILNVKRIPIEGEDLEGTEPSAIMDLADPDVWFEHDIHYRLRAQVQGQALLVTGRLETPATLHCSRCVRVFERLVTVSGFVFHQELQGEDFVDLTANIREDIILELPQRALCNENCQGLCPQCGGDLNERPCQCQVARPELRWQALDRLKIT